MYCNSSYQAFSQCTNGFLYNQQANSCENINIGIISKDTYKNLIITSMHFHETKGQVDQIKMQIQMQCITNSMKPRHTINTKMSNEYSSKVLPAA
jgi:hypothetical protein